MSVHLATPETVQGVRAGDPVRITKCAADLHTGSAGIVESIEGYRRGWRRGVWVPQDSWAFRVRLTGHSVCRAVEVAPAEPSETRKQASR